MATVSVVVPTFNRLGLLSRALASALDQTFSDFEIIVVDDGSTDGTDQFIQTLTDSRIRLIRHEMNMGYVRARNTGIDAAHGEFIAFLDSDDEWLPTKLEKQVNAYRRYGTPRTGLVTCGWTWGAGYEVPQVYGDLKKRIWMRDFRIISSTVFTTTQALRQIGSFDPKLVAYDEFEMSLRMISEYDVVNVPEVLAVIHEHSGERVSKNRNHIAAYEYLLRKHDVELNRQPDVAAVWHAKLAWCYKTDGNLRTSRYHLRRSLQYWPWNPKRWLLYLLQMAPGGSSKQVLGGYALASRLKSRLLRRN